MKRLLLAAAALAGLLSVGVAQAYILPSGSILRHYADGRDKLSLFTLRVDASATFTGAGAKEAAAAIGVPADRTELQLDAVVSLKLPGKCRFDYSSPEGTNKGAVIFNNGKKRVEGTELPTAAVALEEICALLAVRTVSENEARTVVEKHLRSRGIELQKTSLARFGGEVAYVLGDAAQTSPQFWVYKDEFLPARIRYADPQGTAWDVRFIDYASAATGEWFPRMVEVSRGSEQVMRLTGLKADSKGAINDKLF